MTFWRRRSTDSKPKETPDDAVARAARALMELAANPPPSALEEQALTLSNLANYQSQAGNNEKALSIQQEAVSTWRTLSEDGSDGHKHRLAGSLHNLGVFLYRQGRSAESLAFAEEAAEIERALYQSNYDEYASDFAMALSNLSIHRSLLSRPQKDVLEPQEESVEIRRKLAKSNPAAHGLDLANSLAVISASYVKFGKVAEAVPVAKEAVALSRKVAKADAASQAILALSLWSLAQAQLVTAATPSTLREALRHAVEAAKIYQRLSNGKDPFADHLTNILTTTANSGLTKLQRTDEARQLQDLARSGQTTKAIAILERLASTEG